MKVIGLTGSIGMGKSTVARMFEDLGAAVWNADAAVHRLYAKGGAAVAPIGEAFPDAVIDGAVNRERLGALVLNDRGALPSLEAIVHPLVAKDRLEFAADAERRGAPMAVFDIPLLFETDQADAFDAVIVVSASGEVQRRRVLARPGMTEEKLRVILSRQLPDAQKRIRADHVISTDLSLEETREVVKSIYDDLLAQG